MNELKNIDIKENSFTANGKTYHIETEMSIQRAVYAEAAKIEMEGGMQLGKQLEDWKKIYELANTLKFADIAVMAYNNMRGFKNFFETNHPVLKLCACFINKSDEDRRYISDDLVKTKIQDWSEEGLSMRNFFLLALTFLKADTENYKNATESILRLVKDFNQNVNEDKLNIAISE